MAWAIYRDIVYSGTEEHNSRDQRKKIIRFNQFVFLAVLINLFCLITYFYHRLYISALINITSAYIFIVAYYLNSKRRLEIGRLVSVINVNLYLIIICYVEGLKASEYLLFFPYFLVLTFVVGFRRNSKELILVYSLTVASLLLSFIISPMTSGIQIMTPVLYSKLSATILTGSFIITLISSYAILRVNNDNEVLIQEEKKFGDTIYNTSLDAVLIIFTQSNIVASCNKRALELFGVTDKRDIEGTQIDNWFDKDNIKKFDSIEQSISKESKGWQGNLSFQTNAGHVFYAYVSAVPLAYKEIRYTKISILEISNLKMAEFELVKAKDEEKTAALQMFTGIRILIAEDNPVNLSVAKRFLMKWGIEVQEATNGREAVNKFISNEYDVLLIDLEMPEMDGISALREIRKLNTSIPAVAFTAAVYDNMQADLLQKGFTDFIHKPFRPEDLHAKISFLVAALKSA